MTNAEGLLTAKSGPANQGGRPSAQPIRAPSRRPRSVL